MSVPEKRNIGEAARRIVLLQMTSDLVGQPKLADAIGITTRGLRHKLAVKRSVTDADLSAAALVVDGQIAALGHLRASLESEVA